MPTISWDSRPVRMRSRIGSETGGLPIPQSLRAGRKVHYYPLSGPVYGELATIISVQDRDNIVIQYGSQQLASIQGGTNGTRRGQRGTWDHLDSRHRRQLRIHGTHANRLFDNLIADPTLFDFWLSKGIDWKITPVDIIVQLEDPNPIGYWYPTIDAAYDKALSLGMLVNFGLLTVVRFTSTTDWWNRSQWDYHAERLYYYWERLKSRTDIWLHCQMETTENPTQACYQATLDQYGKTVEDVRDAAQNYLHAIRSTGLRTIVRPFSATDRALPLVVEAGAPGSVYCNELNTQIGKRYRQSEASFYNYNAQTVAKMGQMAAEMPPHAEYVNLHIEGELRVTGDPLRENWKEEFTRQPIHELVELVDGWQSVPLHGSPVNPPYLLTRDWYYCLTQNNSGTKRASANDVVALWTVADETTGTAAKRCVGSGRGTTRQVDIQPWRRTAAVDVIDNTIPVGETGWTPYIAGANDARCFRIAPGIWGPTPQAAFSFAFSYILGAAPAGGTTYGIAGNLQVNSGNGGWCIYDDGALKMAVARTGGVDTWTIDANPTRGVTRKIVIGYGTNAEATNQWRVDTLGYQTPSNARTASGLAITLGATHNPLDRTTVWGSNGVIPKDTDVMFWDRLLTNAEVTAVRDHRWPISYDYF